ncbi:MAG: NAD(P)/FAD-dependent oxidoreductase, partial [Longimicrobiales bacterium]
GYELMKRGHEVIVLDASGRHGGHVFTVRDGMSDGLYADGGAEHITKPGYERFWQYTEELDLTVLPYPRRENILRRIDGHFYTEEMLHDPAVLKGFGFNQRETSYLSENPWWDLQSLYVKPYLGKFTDEYQPYGVGYDDLDNTPLAEIYRKDGASGAALRFLGGAHTSALYGLWYAAILHLRGVPIFPPKVYRLKGGNQGLPNAFAKRLGSRVKLNCPIVAIEHGEKGVTITYKEYGEEKKMSADFLANCIPLPAFRKIPVTPAFPPEKRYVVDNVTYGSYSRLIFQARSKFWLEDDLSINMELDHPSISSIWQVADEVDTHRVALMGVGPGGISPLRALAGFREVYPGKHITIEQAMVQDWTKERWAPTCERLSFPMNTLRKFWPHVITPHGRIHFAGAYADNLNWGMEAATRSANRVAREIDQA